MGEKRMTEERRESRGIIREERRGEITERGRKVEKREEERKGRKKWRKRGRERGKREREREERR